MPLGILDTNSVGGRGAVLDHFTARPDVTPQAAFNTPGLKHQRQRRSGLGLDQYLGEAETTGASSAAYLYRTIGKSAVPMRAR